MITSNSEPVFIGVVVNPKTKAPIYVVRRANYERSIDIIAATPGDGGKHIYSNVAEGYLNEDIDFAGPTEVSGYPRSHTPQAMARDLRGGGYGTALYTGLVLLATAAYEGEISLPGLRGNARGISSTGSDGTRSASANAWWNAALDRGLTDRSSGYTEGTEGETETEEDEGDISEYVSHSAVNRIKRAIADEINATEWSLDGFDLRVQVTRDVETSDTRGSELISVDTYTYQSAVDHHLVAVRETHRGGMMSWAQSTRTSMQTAYKDVILALNVAKEDIRIVGRLAMLAKEDGASEAEIAAFLMRNRLGVDITSREVTFERPAVPVATPVVVKPRRAPGPERHRGVGHEPPAPNPPPVIKRNPQPTPTAGEMRVLDRDLRELEQRRADLGWNNLEDL